MKKNIHFLIVLIVVILLTAGCGSRLEENGLNDRVIEITSSKMNSQKEVSVKEKQLIRLGLLEKEEAVDRSEEEPASEIEQVDKEIEPKEEKTSSKEQELIYTTEKMSGDFMSTIALNMRKGPSTDFQLVGNLQPYEKVVASEKATLNGSTWYKITAKDTTGWAAANYLVTYEKKESSIEETEKATAKKKDEQSAKQEKEVSISKPKEVTPKEETTPSTSVTPSSIEKAVIDLTNAEREKAGLAPYKVDHKLVASARAKSNDMATNNYFDHNSPTYGSAGTQLGQFGVSFRGWGENIAKGQQSAEQVVTEWMNSPGHKKNILHADMTHIGVGYDANGHYWTQQFIYK